MADKVWNAEKLSALALLAQTHTALGRLNHDEATAVVSLAVTAATNPGLCGADLVAKWKQADA